MAKSANYRVQLRRRRAGKTDYQARKAMVVSGRPRLVARPSIKNVTAQIIIAKPQGDQVLAAANSRELIKKYGWKAATGNLPAAYLTGLLCGLKAKAAGVDAAILDIGMAIPIKSSRVFAVLNGVLDAGVEVPHGEEKIVHERSKGNHIASYAEELGVDSDEYKAKFSKSTAPEKMPEQYSKAKAAIAASFKGATIAPEPEEKPAAKKAPAKEKALPPKEKAAPAKEKAPAKAPETAPVKEKAPAAPAAKEAPKTKAPEAKAVEAKAAPAKEEAPAKKAPKTPKAEKAAPKAEKVVKEKAKVKDAQAKAAPKEKASAAKEKAPSSKEKAAPAKEKAPAKKATKKGEKKE